ncbi:TPA: periplasmic heavy metal sensor [Escherichia coli]|nr:periplasmic heavy metal sensor [Escherichia coli]HAG6750924.1 periplasmic heavy metal sensor [Escherichia coli]HAG6775558.1 periplasmic heavy metal sensor [Escherichia coli]
MKRNTKIALVMMALSAMAMGSTSAFAHGGHGMWQQNAAPLTSEQQTAWQKIHNDFYAQSSALQQQLVTKRYEYSAAIFLIPICISFDTAEKRRYATYLILNRRFSFEF